MLTSGDARADLDRGRSAARRFAWAEAFEALSLADRSTPLHADDLEVLGTAAYLVGNVAECVKALARAYLAHVESARPRQAARAVFWIAYALGNAGDAAQAAGWLARARRQLESQPPDCAESGLVLTADAFARMMAGDFEGGLTLAAGATEIGRRTGDKDLHCLALSQCGAALVKVGRPADAMALFDEAMVSVVSAEISPIAAGTVYCTVISLCGELADLRRAQEWTEAMDDWCGKQDMVLFTGHCLVHRAELLQLRGRWAEAVEEAERACTRVAGSPEAFATGHARYRQAEIHRVCGEFAAAEDAYRQASGWGAKVCPGLALLRLAQGDVAAAGAAMTRALAETADPLARARLLPAQVEIALAAGDLAAAGRAVRELSPARPTVTVRRLCSPRRVTRTVRSTSPKASRPPR